MNPLQFSEAVNREMGARFGHGLLVASTSHSAGGERGREWQLNLAKKVGGHRRTSLHAVGQLMRVLQAIDLSSNSLTAPTKEPNT